MPKEYSPEERLLNLIKRKKAKVSPENQKAAPPREEPIKPKEGASVPSVSPEWGGSAKLDSIKILNTVLFIALIGVLLYFLADAFLIPAKELAIPKEDISKRPAEAEGPEVKPVTYYLKDIPGKEVFGPGVKEGAQDIKPEAPVEELMANLSLLGIVSGENPQAIIEDKKQMKTFFIRVGQSAGGIEVKNINDGTVTVVYKGEEFTLSM